MPAARNLAVGRCDPSAWVGLVLIGASAGMWALGACTARNEQTRKCSPPGCSLVDANNSGDVVSTMPTEGGDELDGGPSSAEMAADSSDAQSSFSWKLPAGFPEPAVPDDNPMTADKIELGRYLFYDRRLSRDHSQACSTCHVQSLAFTDGRRQSRGTAGESTPRSSMSLANLAYASTLTWAAPTLFRLEDQALIPLFGDRPVELGLRSEGELTERLSQVELYRDQFARAFPQSSDPITVSNVVRAVSCFQRTLISGNAPYDRFIQGDDRALGSSAWRGHELFHSERLQCGVCHAGFAFTDHVNWVDKAFFTQPYHNTGLYNIDGEGGYPSPNTGQYLTSGNPRHMGRFKTPTLRNIAVTAPYMHDGSIATLDEVLDHYAAGGRTIVSGPYTGDGSRNPFKSSRVQGFVLTEQERADVLAFLNSLTDEEFLADPRFSDPWQPDP